MVDRGAFDVVVCPQSVLKRDEHWSFSKQMQGLRRELGLPPPPFDPLAPERQCPRWRVLALGKPSQAPKAPTTVGEDTIVCNLNP